MGPEILLMVVLAGTSGAAIGIFTGLIPGIHVNTAATILLGSYPLMNELISGFADPSVTPVLISCCIMSAGATHSFVDFVPSVFIGAPDADESLSLLPGHRLLMQGAGMVAVRSAAIGSLVGALSALALSIPLQWVMMNGLSGYIDYFTTGVILVTLGIIIFGSSNPVLATVIVIVTGSMGWAINNLDIPPISFIDGGTFLFPLLTGLFGIPPLLEKRSQGRSVAQHDRIRRPVGIGPGIKGVITGLVAGWFPGVTATAGATLTAAFSEERDPARFISMTASIGTVTSVFSIVTLSVSRSGRSGTSMAVKQIIGDSLYGFCTETFLCILLSILIGSVIGFFATIGCGKMMSVMTEKIPEELLNNITLALIVTLVLLFTGPFGLVILILSAVVGSIPPYSNLSRVTLSGCLMVPVLL